MGLIYKIANDVNDKVYVGQTLQTLKNRIKGHKFDSKIKPYPIYRAIRKYGWKHFFFEILEDNIPLEKLNERELYWTNKLNALRPHGYSLVAGQNGRIVSEESKRKMSIARKGKNHPLYGKHHSKETKRKLSEAKQGENNPMARAILCYDLNNNFIKEYNCLSDASRELNLNVCNIWGACNGKQKRVKKYKFKYKK